MRVIGGWASGLMLFCVLLQSARVEGAAMPPQQTYWAGFAYSGDQASRHDVAPNSTAVIEQRGVESLNATLWASSSRALTSKGPVSIELINDQLAKLDGSTSALALAAALDRELVSIEPIGGQFKLLVEIALQALFFDFRDMQVIAAYPLTLQRIEVFNHEPKQSDIEAVFANLLYGDQDYSFPTAFAAILPGVHLPSAATRRLRVGEISIAEGVLDRYPGTPNEAVLRPMLAHEFTKLLSSNTGIGLLPAAAGQAVGGAMAARFADGRVYQLKIPKADYEVRLHLDALKSGIMNETPSVKTLLFGAFFSVSVVEPFSGKSFFDQPLRKGASKIVPVTQSSVDYWAASYETLLIGLNAFSGAAADLPESQEWLREQKPGGSPLNKQVKALQELVQSCR